MPDLTAKRTLVKSPPELWSELSEVERLARHLGAFGEITITKLEPEHTVAWEGEAASGTVSIEPSGWGTKVTLTAQLEGGEVAVVEEDAAAQEGDVTLHESAAPETAAGEEVEDEAVMAAAEEEPAVDVPAAVEPPSVDRVSGPGVPYEHQSRTPVVMQEGDVTLHESAALETAAGEEVEDEAVMAAGEEAEEEVVMAAAEEEPAVDVPAAVEPPSVEAPAVEAPAVAAPAVEHPAPEPVEPVEPIGVKPRRKRGFLAWLFRQRTSGQGVAAPPVPAPAAPVAEASAVQESPVVEGPMAEERPMAEEAPVAQEPVAEEPPLAEEPPVAEERPMAEEAPVAQEPVAEEPPLAEEPPVAEEPVEVEEPAVLAAPADVEDPGSRERTSAEEGAAHETRLDRERAQAILDGALDALGSAHHRPFSRG